MQNFILTCIKSNGKKIDFWFLLIKFNLLNWKILHIKKKRWSSIGIPVGRKLIAKRIYTSISLCYHISTYVFLQLECSLLMAQVPRQVESLSWLEPRWLWLLVGEAEGAEHGLPQWLVSLPPLKKQSTNSRYITHHTERKLFLKEQLRLFQKCYYHPFINRLFWAANMLLLPQRIEYTPQ
jgi:hypothetical protein